jgi:hypothetical protein
MKRMWLALGLACLACCLPLIIPFLGVAGLAGLGAWTGGLNWAEIACSAAIAGAVVVAVLFVVRRRRASGPACDIRK